MSNDFLIPSSGEIVGDNLSETINHIIANNEIFRGPFWSRKTLAKFLGVSPGTIAVWDCIGRYNLEPIKMGRSVRYIPAKIVAFLIEQQMIGKFRKAAYQLDIVGHK